MPIRTFDQTQVYRNRAIGEHYAREQQGSVAQHAISRKEGSASSNPWSGIDPYSIEYGRRSGDGQQSYSPVPGPGGKMLLAFTILQLLGPAHARAAKEGVQMGDAQGQAPPSTEEQHDHGSNDTEGKTGKIAPEDAEAFTRDIERQKRHVTAPALKESFHAKDLLHAPTVGDGWDSGGDELRVAAISGDMRPARELRSVYRVSAPKHVETTIIGEWPNRWATARQTLMDHGIDPDQYRVTHTRSAPGPFVSVSSFTNDTVLEQYYRSGVVVPGVASDGSRGLTDLPKPDQAYEEAWARFAATELPALQEKTAHAMTRLFKSSFGIDPKRDSATIYQIVSDRKPPEGTFWSAVRAIETMNDLANLRDPRKWAVPGDTGYLVHFPNKDRTVAVWESDGRLHMESVPQGVFDRLKAGRAPSAWVSTRTESFFSEDLRGRDRFGEAFRAKPASGEISLTHAAMEVANRILDPVRLEKAGYVETEFESFVHTAYNLLVPYYDALRKAVNGDMEGALSSAAEEAFYDILFAGVAKAAAKGLLKGAKAVGKADFEHLRKAFRETLEELDIPKAEDFGSYVKKICKRGTGGDCTPKPEGIREQKQAAKGANRHHLARPDADPEGWTRGLTTKRVADLFGNAKNLDGTYRLTAQQAQAGFDGHLMQIQQEINSAVAVFKNFGTTTEQGKKLIRWIARSILAAAEEARFDFGRRALNFGPDLGWLKFERIDGRIVVSSRP